MAIENRSTDYLKDYYRNWISVYKEGAIRSVTLSKYHMSLSWLERLAPNLRLCDVTRVAYQQIINEYAKEHERQTTMDFHHQLKGSILDAVDEGSFHAIRPEKLLSKEKPSPKRKSNI